MEKNEETKSNNKDEAVSTSGEVLKFKSSRCNILGAPKNHSAELTKILDASISAAKKYGSSYVASEHLIYAMLDNECIAGKVLKACNVDVGRLS